MDLTTPKSTNTTSEIILYKCARGVAVVSAVFSLVVIILLVASWLRVKDQPPSDLAELNDLIELVKADPQNTELKGAVRDLDLLARRAQFNWFDFAKRGSLLLLSGVIFLAASLKIMSGIKLDMPAPGAQQKEEGATLSRWLVACFGAVFAIVVLSFWISPLSQAGFAAAGEEGAGPVKDPEVPAKTYEVLAEAEWQKNWPQLRGYLGHGVQTNVKPPTQWNAESGRNILWKTKSPLPGFGSVVVWGKRAFVTGAISGKAAVICLDADTGKVLWQGTPKPPRKPNGPKEEDIMEDTGYAASTPACDGHRVFAVFANGVLACFDFEGKQLWVRSLGVPVINYGYASSLGIYKDLLYVQIDVGEKGRALAIDVNTGKTRWEVLRNMEQSWSSPVLVPVGDKMSVVLNGNPEVRSYDAATGKELWKWNGMGGEVATSAAYADGKVYMTQEFAQTACLNAADGKVLWHTEPDAMPDVSSPVVVGERLLLSTAPGTIACHNVKDGKIKWTKDLDVGFYASPIVVGKNAYFVDRNGVTHVLEVGDSFKRIAENALGEKSDCTPAFVGNRVYMRSKKHIWCIGERK